MYGEDGICQLCGERENDYFHIIVRCPALKEALKIFDPILKQFIGVDITENEVCFGLFEGHNIKATNLRNFITYQIRSAAFRMRNIKFQNISAAAKSITEKASKDIKKELIMKMRIYLKKDSLEAFKDIYLYKNVLGEIRGGLIVFSI